MMSPETVKQTAHHNQSDVRVLTSHHDIHGNENLLEAKFECDGNGA